MNEPSTSSSLSQPAPVPGAFELLHSGVQRQLWQMQWTNLRPLQVDAIRYLLQTEGDAILSAATASGKTEAAFLPVLSKIAAQPRGSVRVMYVGPLKALINDQFGRIEELCNHLDVPVHRWHGDVPASKKAKLVQNPGGVLLITPESLESLFINRSSALRSLFGGLEFVVVDELHSFLDNERGLHLRSLLSRLNGVAVLPFRRIGLSATIGDAGVAKRYLATDHPDRVEVICDSGTSRETKFRIHAYRESAAADSDDLRRADDPDSIGPSEDTLRIAADIVRHCSGHANLVFANRKSDVEEYADGCALVASRQGLRDAFLVHHGSLSAEIRRDTEETMKDGTTATTFCSSTLEMGIDIGSVHAVGQIGPPSSVASLKQRIGRSGRREGESQTMRVYVLCRRVDHRPSLFDRLHLGLVQSVAVTELMLEGWVEPASPPVCDLSTLTQQIISLIAQHGGTRADQIFDALCVKGPFRDIERRLFVLLLRNLAARDVIEQADDGMLILGLLGEKLRKDKGFYAVFPTPEEYAVLHDGRVLGSVQSAYDVGDHLLFAGRRWQITDVDEALRQIRVIRARGRKPPPFNGNGAEIHPRVRQKMRDVLMQAGTYTYLNADGIQLIKEARTAALDAGLFDSSVIELGPQKSALLTWTGTRIQRTLQAGFSNIFKEPEDEDIALVFDVGATELRDHVDESVMRSQDSMQLARLMPQRRARKYDWLLDDDLLDVSVSRGLIDVDGAAEVLRALA